MSECTMIIILGGIDCFDTLCLYALCSSWYFSSPILDLNLDAEQHVNRSEFPQDDPVLMYYDYPPPINLNLAVFNHTAEGMSASIIMPVFTDPNTGELVNCSSSFNMTLTIAA